ncbi:MAG: ParB/RepB/Spo0J family partition protein [Schleiferilactobacillus harbinensis]|jgi:ParB family chromosome partitioning protein|nr:ParB/RepB/Spo0J family partition protein [Schleiferilactobacillus harbinensis]MCI1913950.1 ParB/RepB/Spo0J family partition protein [Schleiferilactobacillus harbinensis]
MAIKKRKGLGRGIDALFADMDAADKAQEMVEELPVADIRPNPYQPRRRFTDEGLQELAHSIVQNGVLQPVILRKSVNGYELIAGERRLRASKIAQKKTIPAIIRQLDDSTMMEAAILENLQREDLNPLEEAEAYDMMLKRLHLTQAEVSERLGKSRPYIANYLRVLSLPTPVKSQLADGTLSMGQARTLLGLKDKTQIIPVAKKTIKESLTVRQLEKLVSEMNHTQPQKRTAKPHRSKFVAATEKQLRERFQTKVAIQEGKAGKGRIEIPYVSTDDLNRILDMLSISLDD